MARDFDGSTDRIDYASVFDPKDSDLTISAWVYLDDNSTYQYIANIGDGNDYGLMMTVGRFNTGELGLNRRASTPSDTYRFKGRYGTGGLTTGAWHHILVHDDGSPFDYTGMECYVDGAVPGSVTTVGSGTVESSHDGSWSIGGRINSDTRCLNGRVAEFAVWDRELDAGEIAALAKRYSPLFFLRGLRFYPKLIGRKDIDIIAGKTPTYDGSDVAVHPPILYPG